MKKYYPKQGDWVKYCKEVLNRDEPLRNGFHPITKDSREWRNFLAWFRYHKKKQQESEE